MTLLFLFGPFFFSAFRVFSWLRFRHASTRGLFEDPGPAEFAAGTNRSIGTTQTIPRGGGVQLMEGSTMARHHFFVDGRFVIHIIAVFCDIIYICISFLMFGVTYHVKSKDGDPDPMGRIMLPGQGKRVVNLCSKVILESVHREFPLVSF